MCSINFTLIFDYEAMDKVVHYFQKPPEPDFFLRGDLGQQEFLMIRMKGFRYVRFWGDGW